MTGKRLLWRIGWALALSAGLLVLLSSLQTEATPIRPDIKKLVQQPERARMPYTPARAGWNGPEQAPAPASAGNPSLNRAASIHAMQAALLAAAVPDPRAILAIVAAIFLLRMLKSYDRRKPPAAEAMGLQPPSEHKNAA